jgi:superfamily II DNA or RNA helicase
MVNVSEKCCKFSISIRPLRRVRRSPWARACWRNHEPCIDDYRTMVCAPGVEPFPFQREVWQAYLAGESGLIHATTGAGKTYAAWMGPIAEWLASMPPDRAAPPLRVLWITPLRALATDTVEALRAPLDDLSIPGRSKRAPATPPLPHAPVSAVACPDCAGDHPRKPLAAAHPT